MNNYKKTDKLLDILKKSPTVDDYIENENDNLVNMTLSEYLNKILSDRNLKTSDLVGQLNKKGVPVRHNSHIADNRLLLFGIEGLIVARTDL